MPSIGPLSPGTVVTGGGAGTAWSLAGNAVADDGAYATANNSSGLTEELQATNFDFSALSGSAQIDGVEVKVHRLANASTSWYDYSAKLMIGGVSSGTNKAAGIFFGTTEGIVTYGGPTDKWGLGTITAAQVKASNFGFAFAAYNNVPSSRTAWVDYISIRVYYTIVSETFDETALSMTVLVPTTSSQTLDAVELGREQVIRPSLVVLDTQDHSELAREQAIIAQFSHTNALIMDETGRQTVILAVLEGSDFKGYEEVGLVELIPVTLSATTQMTMAELAAAQVARAVLDAQDSNIVTEEGLQLLRLVLDGTEYLVVALTGIPLVSRFQVDDPYPARLIGVNEPYVMSLVAHDLYEATVLNPVETEDE